MNRLLQYLAAIPLLWIASTAQAQLQITIDRGSTGAQPIAIVPFEGNGELTDVAKIVDDDLVRSGRFYTLARTDMLEKPSDPANVNFQNWRIVNMNHVVIGSVTRDPATDMVSTRFYLMDVYGGQQVLGFDMPAVRSEQLRYVGHQIADLVFEKLTGIKGVFNTKIAYISSNGYGRDRQYKLIVADADGYAPRTVATSRDPLMSPSWSPDRKRLSYVGYERGSMAVFIHTLATGEVRKLTAEKGINGSPAWSPDGTRIALTLSFETNSDIYVVEVASGKRTRLTNHYAIDTEAAWSPDGQWIVFTSDRGGNPQIYRLPATGGEPERMTFEGRQNLRASYSPDGKKLVLVNYDQGRYRIATLDVETRQLSVLTDGNLDEGPSWAPNGDVIIYTTQGGSSATLATITADGRVKQTLRQPGSVQEPAWSPFFNQ